MNKSKKLIICDFDNYLSTIILSPKTKMFQKLIVKQGNKKLDILNNGELSCALFVSSILKMFNLVKSRHATVDGLQRDLEKFGWHCVKKPLPGAIIFWEGKFSKQGNHKHVGFYISKDRAISNSTAKGFPVKHHWTYGQKNGQPKRRVERILVWPKF